MRITILLLPALLVGCAATGPVVLEGNSETVIVDWSESTVGATGALAAADQHCAKYGRKARYSGKPNDLKLAYDCVK